jgi:hypothetical protein
MTTTFKETARPGAIVARFTALEWLAVAAIAGARPGRKDALLRNLRSLHGQCANDPERRRLDALIDMAMLIAAPDLTRLARRLDAFLAAGFSNAHLHLLTESMERGTAMTTA